MKKRQQKTEHGPVEEDGILPEYDFSGGRRNKFASRYAAGSAVIADEVNAALRALGEIIHKHRPRDAGFRPGGR
jgi:hypothetical protein